MKLSKVYIVLIFLSLIFSSCKSKNDSPFTAKPVEMEVGKIKVVVDPNVEMMMILGRLSGANMYSRSNDFSIPYINELDEFFKDYREDPAVEIIRPFNSMSSIILEFGYDLNESVTGYKMSLDNKNFMEVYQKLEKKKILLYSEKSNLEKIRQFRINSKFDDFFNSHKQEYENKVKAFANFIVECNLENWLNDFYGTKVKETNGVFLSYLGNGGNFAMLFRNSKGRDVPHILLSCGFYDKNSVLLLLSHEFSHPRTMEITNKLYKNARIKKIFDALYKKYSTLFQSHYYNSGYYVLNETINQACANKFLEKNLSKEMMDEINQKEEIECQKMIYLPQIAEFLDNYENNRKKYKTLDDFIPELEKFIEGLD